MNLMCCDKIIKGMLVCLYGLLLSGCAAPVPIEENFGGFVSRQELQVVALAREGIALFDSSRFFESESRFRKALYLDPSLDNIRYNLANTLEKTGAVEESEEIFKSLIKKYPDNYNYQAALARLYVSTEKYELARNIIIDARALAESKEDFESATRLTQTLMTVDLTSGNVQEAICEGYQSIDNALSNKQILPKDIFLQVMKLLLAGGQIKRADSLFDRSAFDVFPENTAPSLYLKASLAFAQGDIPEALSLSERVLTFPGLDADMQFDLSTMNLVSRYLTADPTLFVLDKEKGFFASLAQSLKASPLSAFYWSPQLFLAVREMIADPELSAMLE